MDSSGLLVNSIYEVVSPKHPLVFEMSPPIVLEIPLHRLWSIHLCLCPCLFSRFFEGKKKKKRKEIARFLWKISLDACGVVSRRHEGMHIFEEDIRPGWNAKEKRRECNYAKRRVHRKKEEFRRADFQTSIREREKLLSLYTKNPIIPLLLFTRVITGIIIFWVNIRGKGETDPCWATLKRKRATIDFNIESFSPAPRLPLFEIALCN